MLLDVTYFPPDGKTRICWQAMVDSEDGDDHMSAVDLRDQIFEIQDEDQSESMPESDAEPGPVVEPKRDPSFVPLCTALMHWQPFSKRQQDHEHELEVIRLIRGATDCLAETLRTRLVLRELAREERDIEAIGAGPLGSVVKHHYLTYCVKTKHGIKKTTKLQKLLSRDEVRDMLRRPCRGGQNHTCLHAFREALDGLMLWRRAFYSLDKQTRLNHLIQMFRTAMLPDAIAIGDAGLRRSGANLMKYEFLGSPVCRKAFAQLCGISDGGLQTCFFSSPLG